MMAKYINQKTKFALIPCQRHPPKESLGPLGKGFLWSYLNPRF